ncbi:hypothetical protein [Methanimicrococcus hongohii]|uniref:hypothetical protein n=1 Tax=Methanimicrococcus hongohii TaxID=3028295 RepID=UPI00292FF7D2|nr:hypothetical protein [Methanimicrococcus sp. Hf6]
MEILSRKKRKIKSALISRLHSAPAKTASLQLSFNVAAVNPVYAAAAACRLCCRCQSGFCCRCHLPVSAHCPAALARAVLFLIYFFNPLPIF